MLLFIIDWYCENFNFDFKEKFIVEVEKVILVDLKDYYKKIMLNSEVLCLNI